MKPKQAEIIRHSMSLFNKEGYQSPSIDRISENAGISKMTFYRYYPDKEALILDILQQKECDFMQALQDITADRVAMMMLMLIDGAIAAQQAESSECREIPPGITAWSAAKALIYSEGGTL